MASFGLNTHDRKPPTPTAQGPPCPPGLFTILQGTQQEKYLNFRDGYWLRKAMVGPQRP